jgi:3-oxoacyl-[acyl-carrier protein] reductase
MDVAATSLSDAKGLGAVRKEANRLGRQAWTGLADISHRNEVDDLVENVELALGAVDVLVHTVAIRPSTAFLDLSESLWRETCAVNLDSAFYLSKAVIPSMVRQKWGRIVFFSGVGAFTGGRGHSHVMATKVAITGFARGLAYEFADAGVTVNTVVPGMIETGRTTLLLEQAQVASTTAPAPGLIIPPMGRLARQEEIAATCSFLVSDAAAYITGQCIHVNGGAHFGS